MDTGSCIIRVMEREPQRRTAASIQNSVGSGKNGHLPRVTQKENGTA